MGRKACATCPWRKSTPPGVRKDIGDVELSYSLQILKSGLWVLRDRNGSVLNRFEVLFQMVERLTVKHTGE